MVVCMIYNKLTDQILNIDVIIYFATTYYSVYYFYFVLCFQHIYFLVRFLCSIVNFNDKTYIKYII